jgi:HTH-type transcriptional regulator/antitoxin HigA
LKRYKDANFFVNNSKEDIEEYQADQYAKNHLIDKNLWNDFIVFHENFSDDLIIRFVKETKVHPAIIRGRLCFERPEYYKKRSVINTINYVD